MTSTPKDPHIGRVLGGKWRLDRRIGLGGMATVYAARHRNGTAAAVKVLHPQLARDPEVRDRFMREGYIANTAGPGAVRVLDDDIDEDGTPYLAMELLSGEGVDVRAQLRGGLLPLEDVLWVASETLASLATAHANGVIHRDLKPDNLFWTHDDAIKILDFGVARLRSGVGGTSVGTILGTPSFMAPEQARGASARSDARSDVWSVGAIMFRLLTGEVVRVGDASQRLRAAATAEVRSLRGVGPPQPDGVIAIVDRALAFAPEDRHPTATAMRVAILTYAETSRLSLRPSPAEAFATTGGARAVARAAILPRNPADALLSSGHSIDVVVEEVPPAADDGADVVGLVTGMSDDDTLALRHLLDLLEIATLSREELDARGSRRFQYAAKLSDVRRLEVALEHATRTLATAHVGLFWNVLPEGFATKQGLLWVAKPPLAATAGRMYDDGVRMLGILPGVELEELRRLCQLLRGDLAPFRDYATLLQVTQLAHVVHRIDAARPGLPEHPSLSLEHTLAGGPSVPAMLDTLTEPDPALRAAVLSRLARVAAGHEAAIGARLSSVDEELAVGLLRVLDAIDTDAAREAIQQAVFSPSTVVRLEALARLDPNGDRLREEVERALDASPASQRIELLAMLGGYRLMAATPVVIRRIESAAFDRLPVEERRQAFATLVALAPAQAEEIAEAFADAPGAGATPERLATCAIASRILGRSGRPPP